MSLADEPIATIPQERRIYWEKRLFNSSDCYGGCRKKQDESVWSCECQEWDQEYNTSDDPEVNQLRQAHLANYAIWIHEFAHRLDPEIECALKTFDHDGACMACLGRMSFDYLCAEYLMSSMEKIPLLRYLTRNGALPEDLSPSSNRSSRNLQNAFQNFECLRLVTAIQSHCGGNIHYEKLAQLLNHGKSCPSPLDGSTLEPIRFPLIETEFTQDLLSYRASNGDPQFYLQTFFSLPLAKASEFSQFMRSRTK
jgi:hypothetical protein